MLLSGHGKIYNSNNKVMKSKPRSYRNTCKSETIPVSQVSKPIIGRIKDGKFEESKKDPKDG
jgi:hypothetical protein